MTVQLTSLQMKSNGKKDGVVIEFSERILSLPGEGLLITNTTEDDSGVYTCVAINEEGAMRATAFINVTGPLLSCNGVFTSWHSMYVCTRRDTCSYSIDYSIS